MSVPLPELRVLRYFLAVVEHGSFTRAAAVLHLTQQSLSEAVRKLEAQLGCDLLDRSPGGPRATAAGTVLAREAAELLAAAERAVIRTQLTSGRLSGELRVGSSFDLPEDLRQLLAPLSQTHRGLTLRYSVAPQRDLLSALRNRALDLALTWQLAREDRDAELRTHLVRREPLVALMRAGHPLARPTVALAELLDHEIVMHERELAPGPYDAMIAPLSAIGTPRVSHIDIFTSGHDARTHAVAHTDRIALGTRRSFGHLDPHLTLADLDPSPTVDIIWAHVRSAALAGAAAEATGRDGCRGTLSTG